MAGVSVRPPSLRLTLKVQTTSAARFFYARPTHIGTNGKIDGAPKARGWGANQRASCPVRKADNVAYVARKFSLSGTQKG